MLGSKMWANKSLNKPIPTFSSNNKSNCSRSFFSVSNNNRFGSTTFTKPDFASPLLKQQIAKTQLQVFIRKFSTDIANTRNVAIIAHVDHGKTTLVDKLLQQSGTIKNLGDERVMDSNQLEKERGITILSKVTSMNWKGTKINLVDTPGHGDFGGEVERVLNMVDGVILLVDSAEGVLSQTKFVLTKALAAKLKPIVVINKMDRHDQRADEVEAEIFDLFSSLEATNDQMDYPTLFASSRQGWAVKNRKDEKSDLSPLFESIIKKVPPPFIKNDPRFSMLVTSLESEPYLGRLLTGRVLSGKVVPMQKLKAIDLNGKVIEEQKVIKVLGRYGLERIVLNEGVAGDIISLAGFSSATVTATVCDPELNEPLKATPLDPPVISMTFTVNTSPLAGQEGTQSTFPALRRRLDKEVESNISLSLKKTEEGEAIEVFGRGELQLGILIENMRREGFEFSVSPPKVVFKSDDANTKMEPLEEVVIDVDEQHCGAIIERLTLRKGELQEIKQLGQKSRMIFNVISRGLVGFRSELLTETKGSASYNHLFKEYVEYKGALGTIKKGAIISMADGVTTSYALEPLEARGVMFVAPGTRVYPGMVIGEHSRDSDLEVNPTKTKPVSNVRSVQKDEFVRLTPPRTMTLEESIAYVRSNELLEITPKSLRLRKAPKAPKYNTKK